MLIVWGDQDQTTPFANAAHVRALFPRATTLDVAGARHAVHLDFAEQVHPALTAFLSAAEAG